MKTASFERLALSRLTFGPSDADRDSLNRMGFANWLAEQLEADHRDDPVTRQRVADATLRVKYPANANINGGYPAVDEVRPLRALTQPIEVTWKVLDPDVKAPNPEKPRPRIDVVAATLLRAVYSRWQLRELMVDFWHSHFNVDAVDDVGVGVGLVSYDRDVIRPHALGNFRAFLEAVASASAMLIYLSNRSSRAGNANENYARELFELHTLGRDRYFNAIYDKWRKVPGAETGAPIGYIDQDVYEAARAFTGWTIEDGSTVGPGQILPRTGKFTYVEAWHDNYQKRVLGNEFDPFQAPMQDGRKVLDLVAQHPGTAQFVCRKLCRRFVGDNPPQSLVAGAAALWTKTVKAPDQIAQVMRFIATSPEFRASWGAKIKRPLEVAASFVRAAGIDFTPTEGVIAEMAAGGQRLFGWGPPTGLPDANDYWLSTNAMRRRWSLIFGLSENSWQTGSFDPTKIMGHPDPTAREVAQFWQARLYGAPDPDLADGVVAAMKLDPGQRQDATAKDPKAPFRHLVAYLAMGPDYQLR